MFLQLPYSSIVVCEMQNLLSKPSSLYLKLLFFSAYKKTIEKEGQNIFTTPGPSKGLKTTMKPIWVVDAVRPGESKTLDIKVWYDVNEIQRHHLVATATVIIKKTNERTTDWKFTWHVNEKMVGETRKISVENVQTTQLGFVPVRVEARRKKTVLKKNILILIKKGKKGQISNLINGSVVFLRVRLCFLCSDKEEGHTTQSCVPTSSRQ